MDYLEQRFHRKEILHKIMSEIKVTNPPLEGQQGGGHRVPEQRKSQPILPLRQNGFMAVDDPGHHDGLTYYAQSRPSPGRQPPARRQQSLPGKRMQGDEKERQANSAPSRKVRSLSRKAPLPQLNTLVAKSRGPGGETSRVVTTNFAGYSTKDQEASPTRYTRFASTWAQVRAENHIDMCGPVSPSQDKSPDRDQHGDWSGARSGLGTGRTPDRQAHKDHSPPRSRMDHISHSSSPQSKDSYTKPSTHRKEPAPPHTKAYPHTKKKSREDREKQIIRFEDETGEDDQQDGELPTEAGDGLKPRSAKKRPDWNNRLALSVPIPTETPVKSWKRYEAELTHTPAITSIQEVYKAYTGCSKQQLRDKQRADNDMDMTELRPSTRGSQQTEDSGGPYRPSSQSPSEYILTRNEAKMFIHLQNVYGSEAHRQQRKEWFFKKLGDVQLQELQQKAADKRRKKQRVEESKKRQKRQLMFVRRKFRKEQLHRFRTQYVTSRVLEYEKADRDLYGLPDESDDEGVNGFADDGNFDKEHPLTERSKTKDSFQGNKGSDRKDSKTASERSGKGSQRHYEESEEDSRKANKNDKSVSGASKPKGFVGYTTEPSSESTDISLTPTDDTSASTTVSKNSVQGNTGSKTVKTSQPNADKPVISRTVTKNLKQNPNNDHVSNHKGSDSKQKDTSSTNGNRNTSTNTHTNTATKNQKTSGDMAKPTQKDPVKAKTSKDTATSHNPNVVDTTTSSNTESSRAATNTAKNSARTADAPSENVSSSLLKDRNMPTAATTTGTKNRTSAAQPAASSSAATGAKSQGTKTANESRERNTETVGGKGAEDSSPPKGSSSPRKNKNAEMNKEKTLSMNDNKENNVNQDKHNSLPNKRKDDIPNKNKTNGITGNKQTTNSHENKELNAVTSNDHGSKDSPRKTTLNTAPSKDFKGHASDPSSKPASNNPTVATVPETRDGRSKPSKPTSNNPTVATVPETQDGHNKPSAAEQRDSSRGRKRKPAQPHPKSEAEQKKQMERKYGKIFDVNTGPTWNPGAKPPKMEGIDTVLIKVTDDKGRTRLKKREVKDVVKEAKAQLVVPVPENRKQSGRKEDNSVQPAHNIIRSASADTLDFEEDEEDEEEEDVFERVRRKYNLQIDSDDDDSTV